MILVDILEVNLVGMRIFFWMVWEVVWGGHFEVSVGIDHLYGIPAHTQYIVVLSSPHIQYIVVATWSHSICIEFEIFMWACYYIATAREQAHRAREQAVES